MSPTPAKPNTPEEPKPANLDEALAWLQEHMPRVAKGETATVPTKSGGKYTYDYADLTDITTALYPLMGSVGLSFRCRPTVNSKGQFVLKYSLKHKAGGAENEMKGEFPLPDPTRASFQEIGSAITYARRYVLCAVTGLAPGGDDDDAKSAEHIRNDSTRQTTPPTREPSGREWVKEIGQTLQAKGEDGKLQHPARRRESLLALYNEAEAFQELTPALVKLFTAEGKKLAEQAEKLKAAEPAETDPPAETGS